VKSEKRKVKTKSEKRKSAPTNLSLFVYHFSLFTPFSVRAILSRENRQLADELNVFTKIHGANLVNFGCLGFQVERL
jgi:hypothetical protein